MRRWLRVKGAFLLVAGITVANGAVAAVSCKTGSYGQNDVVVLNVDRLDAGPVELGGELYRQDYENFSTSPDLNCIFDQADETVQLYFTPPSESPMNVLQTPEHKNIYETGLRGVGVSYINRQTKGAAFDSQFLTMSRHFVDAKTGGACKAKALCKLDYHTTIRIVLLKTGPVAPGRVTKIPDLQMTTLSGKIPFFRIRFNLNVSVVSKTCLAKPVIVNMGAHSTRAFTGIGSTAPSKDFLIELTDCPAFNNSSNRVLKYRIDPVLPAYNVSNGILRLNASTLSAESHAASGVGVQVVTNKDIPLPLGVKLDSGIPLRNFGTGYSIPLRARYIQTESKVIPGPANATANFTIIYE